VEGNIYTPGAGNSPPVLAGRSALLESWQANLIAVSSHGRPRAHDTILIGPRGVGKTVALTEFLRLARDKGFETLSLQPATGHAGLVESLFQQTEDATRKGSGPWQRSLRAIERLGGVNFSLLGMGAGATWRAAPERELRVDPGRLASALAILAEEARRDTPGGGLLIAVDEFQSSSPTDVSLLAAALHRLNVEHPSAPVAFAGTGLASVRTALDQAGVTHADRLFRMENIPLLLDTPDALYALIEPARAGGVEWESAALDAIVEATRGYPAHLQLFAHEAWSIASPSVITLSNAEAAVASATTIVETQTLLPRWEHFTDRQMEFITAIAARGGEARISALASALERSVKDLSWTRDTLIKQGEIFAPRRGRVALALPFMGPFALAHYEHARADASVKLASLTQIMRRDAGSA
jgi:hypothetical protein